MKTLSLFTIFAASQFIALSTGSSLTFADLATATPTCALLCFTAAVANSTCQLTDQHCICTDEKLNSQIAGCVQSTCTIKESLTALNLTSIACDAPIRDRRQFYNTISTTFTILAAIALLLRLLSRHLSEVRFGLDDYVITLAFLVGLPNAILNIYGLTNNGLGKDMWTISFSNITNILRVFLISEILYSTAIALTKISILLFYLRIFPGITIRKLIYGTIVFNMVYFTVFDFMALFQCRPISFAWDRWDGEHEGTCLNNNAIAFANAGFSIAIDSWMLYLPIPELLSLNLSLKRKVAITMMFSVGVFVTIVSIIRVPTLLVLARSSNLSWDYIPIGAWSTVEQQVGIVCACMPNIRVLLIRVFPNLLGSTNGSSKYNRSRDPEQSGGRKTSALKSNGGIAYAKTYDVQHHRKEPSRGNSEIELVDVHRNPN